MYGIRIFSYGNKKYSIKKERMMNSLKKMGMFIVLLFAGLQLSARHNKDRALIINNYGASIYFSPNTGKPKTIDKNSSYCIASSSSGSHLSSIKFSSQTDQDLYKAYVYAHDTAAGRLAATTTLDAVTATKNVKKGQIAVVTNSGIKATAPSVVVYTSWNDYVAKNPGAKVPSGVTCPHVLP